MVAPDVWVLSMSQPDDPTSQAILDSVQTVISNQRLLVALAALPMYEYLITFDREVELVWKQKARFSLTSILLVSTRLCMITSAIVALNSTQSTCTGIETMSVIQYIVDVIGFVQTAFFSALRVSALYNRNAVLFVAILVLGLAPATTNILNAARATYIQQPGVCIGGSRIGDALARKLVLISRIPVIVADFLVLILTWAKTYQQTLRSHRLGMPTTLSTCLLRDGAMYFLALLVMNIVQIATHRTRLGAPVSIVIATFPSILISRFMLNLRQIGSLENADGTENSVVSSVRFQLSAEIVGSMGAPLDHGGSIAHDLDDGKQHREDTEAVSHVSRCGEPRTF